MLSQLLLWGLAAIAIACLVSLVIGRAHNFSTADFFLYSEKLDLGSYVGTLIATNLSLGNMVFVSAIVGYFSGWSGVFWLCVTILMLGFGFWMFGSRFRGYIEERGNFGTIHDYIAVHHGSNDKSLFALKKLTSILSAISLLLAITIEAHLGTKFLAAVANIPQVVLITAFILIVAAYTSQGGFFSVIWTDVLQAFLMLLALVAGALLLGFVLPKSMTFEQAGYTTEPWAVFTGIGWPTAVGLSVLGFCWLVTTPDTHAYPHSSGAIC